MSSELLRVLRTARTRAQDRLTVTVPEYAIRLDPDLGDAGLLLEPASVLAEAWEQTELISAPTRGASRSPWSPATSMTSVSPPMPEAKWVVFYSLGDGPGGGIYYGAHPIEQVGYHLGMLAYA